jgi:hypothetical protein
MSGEFETDREALNPYASPQAIEPALTAELPVDVWAMRDRVIAHRSANWPRVCVLSGAEGVNPIDLTIETHYPIWLFLAFIGCFGSSMALAAFLIPMPYTPMGAIATLVANAVGVIAALVYFARPSQVRFYLSSAMFERRKRYLRMAMFVNGVGVLTIVGSLFLPSGWTGPIFFLGVLVLVIGGQLNRKWNTILSPLKMTREYTVFRGAGKSFLATLPGWPFGAV